MDAVGGSFVVVRLGVAIDTGNIGVIGLIDMAIGTNRAMMRELPEIIVIEGSAQPTRGAVASGGCASRRETRGNVIRYAATERHRALPRGHMAAVAIGRQISGIIIVHVASRAWGFCWIGMRAGERETRRAVVEHARRPSGDRVARGALRRCIRETCRDVVRHSAAYSCGAVPSAYMAAVAIGGIQRVIVADMARSTWRGRWRHMCANQSEAGDAVIEGGCIPTGGGVAIRAVCRREARASRGVNGIVGALPGGQVAARVAAIGRCDFQGVVAIHVAKIAGDGGVFVGERKSRGAVIEFAVRPFCDGMARGTCCRCIGKS